MAELPFGPLEATTSSARRQPFRLGAPPEKPAVLLPRVGVAPAVLEDESPSPEIPVGIGLAGISSGA